MSGSRAKHWHLKADQVQFTTEELQLDGVLELNPNEPMKTTGKLRLLRGRYATPDGSKMGENLALAGHLNITNGEGVFLADRQSERRRGRDPLGKVFRRFQVPEAFN